jgi:hypothetical protein
MQRMSRVVAASFLAAICMEAPPSWAVDETDAAWFARSGVPERGLAMTDQAPLIGRSVQDPNGVEFANVSFILLEPASGTVRYLLASGQKFYGNILLPASEVRIDAAAVHTGQPAEVLLAQRHYSVEEMEKHYEPVNMQQHEFIFPPGLKTQ